MTKIDRGVRYPVSFRLNGELVHGYAENRLLLSDFYATKSVLRGPTWVVNMVSVVRARFSLMAYLSAVA